MQGLKVGQEVMVRAVVTQISEKENRVMVRPMGADAPYEIVASLENILPFIVDENGIKQLDVMGLSFVPEACLNMFRRVVESGAWAAVKQEEGEECTRVVKVPIPED